MDASCTISLPVSTGCNFLAIGTIPDLSALLEDCAKCGSPATFEKECKQEWKDTLRQLTIAHFPAECLTPVELFKRIHVKGNMHFVLTLGLQRERHNDFFELKANETSATLSYQDKWYIAKLTVCEVVTALY